MYRLISLPFWHLRCTQWWHASHSSACWRPLTFSLQTTHDDILLIVPAFENLRGCY